MFAMMPRYWLPNLRANMVDIFVGLSVVIFLVGTSTFAVQVVWTILFLLWTVWIKPKSSQVAVAVQALIAQAMALVAFYQVLPNHGVWVGVLAVWGICYISVRHFLGAFEEDHYRQISAIWAWFGAGITWVLEHWRIEYFTVSQIAVVVTVVGYVLAAMYYLYKNHKLRKNLKQQLIMFLIAALLLIIVLSEWQVSTF
jgi:hypothetical protein